MAWTTPYTFTAGEELTAAKMNEQVRDNWNAAFPIGSLHWRMQAATSVETTIDGFCIEGNGVSVLRATYPDLNTKMGGLSYPWGSADGSHMTLPDVSGRTPVAMAASGHSSADALGDSDSLAKASRNWSPSVSVSGTTGSHTHGAGSYVIATGTVGSGSSGTTPNGGTPISGTSGASTASFSGSGTATVPRVVVGVLAIKY